MQEQIERIGNIIIFNLSGRIDGKVSGELQDIILPLIQKNGCILLNMSEVVYLSSAGLRLLLAVYRRVMQQQAKIALLNVVENVKEVIEITGFISYFTLFEDKHAALKWFESE